MHEKNAQLSNKKGPRVVSSSRNCILSTDLLQRASRYKGASHGQLKFPGTTMKSSRATVMLPRATLRVKLLSVCFPAS